MPGYRNYLFLIVALGLGLPWSLAACSASSSEVVVLAAASLREAFNDLEVAFEATDPDFEVVLDLGPSSLLATRLVEGSPGHVFASADGAQMERVLAATPAAAAEVFATNRIVVVTPADDPAGIETFRDVANPGVDLVLAAPYVPAGAYARRFFDERGLLVAATRNLVSDAADVRDVLTKVRLGEADAGVVYATDITPPIASSVRVIDLPVGRSTLVHYPIAAVSSDHSATAFVRFVLGEEGRSILASHGFGPP